MMLQRLPFLLLLLISICPSLGAQSNIDGSFEHDGELRFYRVYLPSTYSPGASLPLIINMHGFGSTSLEQLVYSNFNALAEDEGVIIVYPQGLVGTTTWGDTGASWDAYFGTGVDDLGFLDRLIDRLYIEYQVDLSRVYATGMSNGGFMSYRLACELDHRIAAIASVTGAMAFEQINNCTPDRPVPVLQIHGTDDLVVPYNGIALFTPNIPTVVEFWRDYNNCETTPETTPLPNTSTFDNTTSTAIKYSCAEATDVWFYVVQNGGHSWPGAFPIAALGNTSQDFSATELIWEFFSQYQHPNPDPVVTSTEELRPTNELLDIFPNPFREGFQLRLKSNEVEHLILRDVVGRVVLERAINGRDEQFFDTSRLLTGLYLLEVQSANKRFTIKLIKN